MIIRTDLPEADAAIAELKKMATFLNFAMLGYGEESHFQKAMELLISKHLSPNVEAERVFPALIGGIALRDVRNEIDLLVPVPVAVAIHDDMKGVVIVVELKVDGDLESAANQLLRYIVAASKSGPREWPVYHKGLVVNFHPTVEISPSESQAPEPKRLPDLLEISASKLHEFIWSA